MKPYSIKNGIFFVFLAVASLGICGCLWSDPFSRPGGQAGEEIFSRAESAFRSKSHRKALHLYNEYLSRYPDGTRAADSLMREGEIYRLSRDYVTAGKVYQYLMDRYPNSPRYSDAMIQILTIRQAEGAYHEIIRAGDAFLKQARSEQAAAQISLIMGDAHMALNSPANAAYYYARAAESPRFADKYAIPKLKTAVRKLKSGDIISLLSRVKEPAARGYLMFQLGLAEVEEERFEDAMLTLSQFVTLSPNHEYAEQARQLMTEIGDRYPSGRQSTDYGQHKIGCLLPLTGSYRIYGNKALNSIKLAMSQSPSGNSFSMIEKDTESDPAKAVTGVEELAREGVSVIIGPIITAESAAPAAQRYGIPMITLTQKSDITQIGDFVFRNFITPQMQVRALVSHATEKRGVRSFAVLYPDEKYGHTFMDLFQREVAAQGGSISISQPYATNINDFRGPVSSLARNRDFEALFIPDAPRKAGMIIPQLAYYGVKKVLLLGTNLWHSDELIRMAGRFAQGAVMPDVFATESSAPEVAEFVRLYQETYGETPGFIEALSYDTAMIVLKVLSDSRVRNPSGVRDALMNVRDYPGVTGQTSFDENGEAQKELFLLTIEGNRFTEIVSP
ncbi:MAG: penicillin-binding protein activator [Desulfococcaceae bacterium]